MSGIRFGGNLGESGIPVWPCEYVFTTLSRRDIWDKLLVIGFFGVITSAVE
jgi:hypothetical protein